MVGPVQFSQGDSCAKPGEEIIRAAPIDIRPSEAYHNACKPTMLGYGANLNSSLGRDYRGQSLYGRVEGPGMAVAYVAGIAALFRSRYPELSAGEIRDKLLESAVMVDVGSGEKCGLARFVD